MEEQNLPCLVLQYNDNNEIVGLEITTTYNYWEKEAFIGINKEKLFPCHNKYVKFKSFFQWDINTMMIPIAGKVYEVNKKMLSTIFYPGYD